jgi:hypothetical protein
VDRDAPIRDPGRPPDKDRNPRDWYVWHFERADAETTRKLVILAERDLRELFSREPTAKRDRKRAERIVSSMYEGQPKTIVAELEGVSEDYVRKCRKRAGQDEATGRRLSLDFDCESQTSAAESSRSTGAPDMRPTHREAA